MARFLRARKPDIRYPGTWLYKIFGKDRNSMREAVDHLVTGRSYALEPSHSSRNNRYHCMNLELTVESDEDRLGIYEALNAHPDILLVL
jgi:putative lipoic acid-binding regulatory protein